MKKYIGCQVDESIHDRLSEIAKSEEQTVAAIIRHLVNSYIQNYELKERMI